MAEKPRSKKEALQPVDHAGHRQRLKKRFDTEGLEHFEEHNILELLLFYTVPRADTNETAHRLLDTFGSFSNVLDASQEELSRVPGVGTESARLLSLLPQVCRRYLDSLTGEAHAITSPQDAARDMLYRYVGRTGELLYMLCLDRRCCLKKCMLIAEGGHTNVEINLQAIVGGALHASAAGVVLFHNHPSGFTAPSGDDLRTTRRLAAALAAVNIALLDHLIVSDGTFIALSDNRLFKPLFSESYRSGCLQFSMNTPKEVR